MEKFVDFALDKGAGELGGALVNPWEFAPKDMLFSEDDMLLVNRTLTSLRLLAKEKGIALAGAYCAIFDKGLKEYQEIYDLVDKVEQPTRRTSSILSGVISASFMAFIQGSGAMYRKVPQSAFFAEDTCLC